jgi:predicted O-linked N-acetylglucosamine transferase (SPINDLY family)
MGSSLLKGLNRDEWIADGPEAFAAIVAGLCDDLPNVRSGKAMRQQQAFQSPLFDGHHLAREVMRLFSELVASRFEP